MCALCYGVICIVQSVTAMQCVHTPWNLEWPFWHPVKSVSTLSVKSDKLTVYWPYQGQDDHLKFRGVYSFMDCAAPKVFCVGKFTRQHKINNKTSIFDKKRE